MNSPTLAIKQADGTFYPIMEERAPGKKRLVLTPAAEERASAQVEIYRGEGQDMNNAVLLTVLNLPATGEPGDIELLLNLDDQGHLEASAGFIGRSEKKEFHTHLGEFSPEDGMALPDLDLPDLDTPSFGDLGDIEDIEDHEGDANPFDMDDEEAPPPRADQDILNDDELAAEGIDEFTFDGMDVEPAQATTPGPVEEDSLGDLGSLDNLGDFSLPDLGAESGEPQPSDLDTGDSFSLDDLSDEASVPADPEDQDLTPSDLEPFSPEASSDEEPLDLSFDDDFMKTSDLPAEEEGDSFGALEDAPLVTGPEDFNLDLDEDFGSTPAPKAKESLGTDFDSGLTGDLDTPLDFDSPVSISDGDFSLDLDKDFDQGDENRLSFGDDFAPTPAPSQADTLDEVPAPPSRSSTRSQLDKRPSAPPREAGGNLNTGVDKWPLVIPLAALVLLLGIFLGLLFLNMTRMTLVPPVQSRSLSGIEPAVAAAPDLPPAGNPQAGVEAAQRLLSSLNHYGTTQGVDQVPVSD